jgi:hypothetical protein
MIAVDTLVHNMLHRTGILRFYQPSHEYGPMCYEKKGCFTVIDKVSKLIDCSNFNKGYPAYFPRFVQHSLFILGWDRPSMPWSWETVREQGSSRPASRKARTVAWAIQARILRKVELSWRR